ncbi:PH and SEC7 domain-containing protein isoform X1 [Octopus sinensis]|uniref:PH and SEC7 domain-containing protein isoform X1 n=1 Tax=Octopus sinensis TaxID=2607531 RepID=A0A6P7SDU9_9MOLL|nr:PH and SEC7 domain-containing protein isoform X1 [Octopus sinensis]XP_029636334.1 PH and SEC7 domain-containing protein isoform X1 [Octopus sinensis]XP_029636335.1 PH and SEC7 domain-containing protein isoform X1 [Octopus sinensis]
MPVKMVDRVSSSPSRIPIPVSCSLHKSSASSNGKLRRPSDVNPKHNDSYVKAMCFENGILDAVAQCTPNATTKKESPKEGTPAESPGKGTGFETFVMTGDMIIKTTAPHKSPKKVDSPKKVPYKQMVYGSNIAEEEEEEEEDDDDEEICLISAEFNRIAAEKKVNENRVVGAPRHHSFSGPDNPKTVHTPLGRVESAPADNRNDGNMNWPSPPLSMSSPPIASPEEFIPSLRQTPSSSMESWDQFEPHPLDPANHQYYQQQQCTQLFTMKESSKRSLSNSDSEPSPEVVESSDDKSSTMASSSSDNEVKSNIVTSKSAEKIVAASRGSHSLVRTSKSHENYLQSGTDITLVSIDIDDDNLAYSLDTLAYQSSGSSLEKLGDKDGLVPVSRSLQSSPERKSSEKSSDRVFMPGFISLDEPRAIKPKGKETKTKDAASTCSKVDSSVEGATDSNIPSGVCNDGGPLSSLLEPQSPVSSEATDRKIEAPTSNLVASILNSRIGVESAEEGVSKEAFIGVDNKPDFITSLRETVEPGNEHLDSDCLYHQPFKSVDRPSAARLAKRLYNLDGFRKSDVSRHLCKKNDFSNLVAEEYLQFFDFTGNTLDVALRTFLKQFSLIGETQERERVLAHFSKRYMTTNPDTYNSEDACHTLTCAIMLLNTDLHGQNVGRKMNCNEFIENLCELNDGDNFPKEDLRQIYAAIKMEPIEWAPDDDLQDSETTVTNDRRQVPLSETPSRLGHNPFLEIPDPNQTTEYKKGYVMRKCCLDPDGRRTSFGKRGWKMFYASLRDMILYLHKDEHGFKKGNLIENSSNAIRIHHSIATRASDYTKKQHVFRLHTSDWAEYLFQTSDSKELQEWMETINYVAASLSAPPLPGGIGSKKKFQRPLMPSSYTKKNLSEQLAHHQEKVTHLEKELHEHRLCPPEKGAKARIIHDYVEKEQFLESELKRFQTYKYLLQSKLSSYKTEVESSLVETIIGEDDETADDCGDRCSPSNTTMSVVSGASSSNKNMKPVQRSLSDSTLTHSADYDFEQMTYEIFNTCTMTTHM